MGYRTSINTINSLGHLIDGNICTFVQQSISSEENWGTNLKFLDNFVNDTIERFYTTRRFWRSIYVDFRILRSEWQRFLKDWEFLRTYQEDDEIYSIHGLFRERPFLFKYLKIISNIFSLCHIKSVLLPGFDPDNKVNKLMIEPKTLYELIEIHPGKTALILQLEKILEKEDLAILNVFPNFEFALNEIDNWPGVFIWNKEDALFLPVKSNEDLFEIYSTIRYESNSINFLRSKFKKLQDESRYAYLFHLSDLHFGNKLAEKRTLRIIKILENHINRIPDMSTLIPIITGDLMQSPSSVNKQTYSWFIELLKSKGFEKPIHILGNHDVHTVGLLRNSQKQKSVILSLSRSSNIILIDDLKLGIIKFDSNQGGRLAQGKIGKEQLTKIGNEIDSIEDKEKYTFIGILHHHPKEIDNPDWYATRWYEVLLGKASFEKTMSLVDADVFLEWIEERNIKLILHGHKHIPNVQKHNDINIIAAGSSSGSIRHQEKNKTYLTYNLIKYDIKNKRPSTCSIYAEELLGAGTKNVLSETL